MSEKLINKIKKIINDADIGNLIGDKFIDYKIGIAKVEKYDIDNTIKNYIINNDSNVNIDDLKNFFVEKIQYWGEDLLSHLGQNLTYIEADKCKKINELINILKDNIISGYTLTINKNDGFLHDYLYLEDGVTGWIRYYETQDNDYIVTFVGYD